MRIAFFLFLLIASGQVRLPAQSFSLFAVSDMSPVFEDVSGIPATDDTIKLFGIRGEIISGQVLISSNSDLSGVTVELSNIVNQSPAYILPANAIEWNFIGSVPLSANAPNQPAAEFTRKAPGKFPDYLKAERYVSIKGGTKLGIYLTIKIPYTATPGNFNGKMTVKSSGGEASIPVALQVFPLDLTADRNLKVAEWYSTNKFSTHHGITTSYSEAWFNMLRHYASNMASHRQNVFRVPMSTITIQKDSAGTLIFNYTRFDQWSQVFWDTPGMDYLETGFLAHFETGSWSSTKIVLNTFTVNDISTGQNIVLEGDQVLPYLLPDFVNHLRSKGWLDKTYFHIQDEPAPHNSQSWIEISRYFHQYAPELIRMDAIESIYVLDDIEVAVPKLDHFGNWYETFRSAREKGVELWFYTVGIYQASLYPNKTIDLPPGNSRIMHWLNYKYDATGYLHWGFNQWTNDPYTDVSMHIGDGWHVYPTPGGLLNSIRWEQMRNGIQEYEYFKMLEQKISSLKDSLGVQFSWIRPDQRSKEIISNVVQSFTKHSNDPVVLYNAKKELIQDLISMNSSPRLYVQTDPPENTCVENRSAISVAGWTESGTTIKVNGTVLPVSDNGLFMGEIFLYQESPTRTLKIQATNQNGTKETIRHFCVNNYTGISKEKLSKISVFPNPVAEFLTVKVPGTYFDLIITDLSGRVFYQKKNNHENMEVDCRNLSPGMYFALIKSSNSNHSEKIIKL